MKITTVSRDNWNEVNEHISQHGILSAVRVSTSSGMSYDLCVGTDVFRIPEELAQELAEADELSPGTYARMYLVGFRQRE